MQIYNNSVVLQFDDTTTGNADSGALVTVRAHNAAAIGTGALATIYDLDDNPLLNPLTTDAMGNYSFKAPDGLYDVVIREGEASEYIIAGVLLLDEYRTKEKLKPAVSAGQTVIPLGLVPWPKSIDVLLNGVILHQSDSDYTYANGTVTLSTPIEPNDVVEIQYGSFSGSLPDYLKYAATPMEYGAVGDGVADDTSAVQECMNAEAITLIDRPYGVSNVTAGKYVTCVNDGKLVNVAGAGGSYTLTLTAKIAGDIVVDCNNNPVSGVDMPDLLGYRQDVNIINVSNSSIGAADSFTTAIRMYSDDAHINNVFVENMINTGYSNGSAPQGLIVGGAKNNVTNCEFRNTRSNVIVTNGAKYHIGDIEIYDTVDNGVYGFGSEGTIDSMTYRGSEEPFVAAGCHATVGKITTIGACKTVVRLQDCRYLDIGEICSTYPVATAFEDRKDNIALAAIGHRSSNVSTESVRIGRITGEYGQSFIATGFGTGVTKVMNIDSVDVELHWVNTTRNPEWDPTNWMNLEGIVQLNFRNFNINIIDVYNELTTSTTEYFRQTFAGAPEESLYENIDVFIRNADGSISANGIYRGAGANEKIHITGARWQTIGNALYSREASTGERDTFLTDLPPQTGYWRKGQRFKVTSYDGVGNHTYFCINSGIAGSGAQFVAMGAIATGAGSPVGAVTPIHLGQIYRDTTAVEGERLWMAYGSTSTFWEQL